MIEPKDVMYYDHIKKELTDSVMDKAMVFYKKGLVEYNDDGSYTCKRLIGYNTRDYTLAPHAEFQWECNCQGWQRKFKDYKLNREVLPNCSHVVALFLKFKLNNTDSWDEAEQYMTELKSTGDWGQTLNKF